MKPLPGLEIGAVLQISPESDPDGFGACLLTVTEVKIWGVQGYVHIPRGGDAYYRVEWPDVEYVGRAVWVRDNEEGDK